MRKNWLLIGVGLLAAVLAVAAIACGDDDTTTGDGNGGDGDDTAVTELTATLEEVEGSGVTGNATITANNGGIGVVATLSGAPEGAHANHLHHGACDDFGEVHITLEELVADADGAAAATTSDDEQPLSHFEEGHYLAVHVGDNDTVGDVITCGDVS